MDIRGELKLTDVNYCRCFWTLKIVVCVALSPQVFVHGALCVSYSGQCFSSEAWGGRSANRGQCAQACRLPYGLVTHPPLRSKPACRKCSGAVGFPRHFCLPGACICLRSRMESWLTWATWHCVITDILTKLPELSGIWLMVGLVLSCYYALDASMKSVDHPNLR